MALWFIFRPDKTAVFRMIRQEIDNKGTFREDPQVVSLGIL